VVKDSGIPGFEVMSLDACPLTFRLVTVPSFQTTLNPQSDGLDLWHTWRKAKKVLLRTLAPIWEYNFKTVILPRTAHLK
jgi:hypothetical protein